MPLIRVSDDVEIYSRPGCLGRTPYGVRGLEWEHQLQAVSLHKVLPNFIVRFGFRGGVAELMLANHMSPSFCPIFDTDRGREPIRANLWGGVVLKSRFRGRSWRCRFYR